MAAGQQLLLQTVVSPANQSLYKIGIHASETACSLSSAAVGSSGEQLLQTMVSPATQSLNVIGIHESETACSLSSAAVGSSGESCQSAFKRHACDAAAALYLQR